ncbi:MAG: hypothetical protein BAA00_10300 [Parageobacillus thermoglucosidasius]|uniref:hypothetical protein n=2 Tax=Parageobacillus thermoglucosidasius TaxID=1426 RepID=UPI000B5673A8|nr:hypothetical protein [Parageobacillus thermoglucosidasius]MBY6266958.1 hypothetical protein [Parageobacillus thermoglucosidasius]OUM90719.1 MAG: hypothetical protein BAA00_10300 [Parageobacillus thermoglucosidasius]
MSERQARRMRKEIVQAIAGKLERVRPAFYGKNLLKNVAVFLVRLTGRRSEEGTRNKFHKGLKSRERYKNGNE